MQNQLRGKMKRVDGENPWKYVVSISDGILPELMISCSKIKGTFTKEIRESLTRYDKKPELIKLIELEVSRFSKEFVGNRRSAHIVAKSFDDPVIERLLDKISEEDKSEAVRILAILALDFRGYGGIHVGLTTLAIKEDEVVKGVLESLTKTMGQKEADRALVTLSQHVVFGNHPINKVGELAKRKFNGLMHDAAAEK